jgi:adenylate kinase
VKALMDRGELVNDGLITGIVHERLAKPDATAGFVLDGFPRTVPQAEALDAIMAGRDPLIVVEMKVPDEELVRRVKGRRVCKECGTNVSAFGAGPGLAQLCERCGGELVTRSDDTEEVVRDRLKVYWRDTAPMIEYYGKRPTFRAIDGAQRPEQVRQALVGAIRELAIAAGVVLGKGTAGFATGRWAAGMSARKGVGA